MTLTFPLAIFHSLPTQTIFKLGSHWHFSQDIKNLNLFKLNWIFALALRDKSISSAPLSRLSSKIHKTLILLLLQYRTTTLVTFVKIKAAIETLNRRTLKTKYNVFRFIGHWKPKYFWWSFYVMISCFWIKFEKPISLCKATDVSSNRNL